MTSASQINQRNPINIAKQAVQKRCKTEVSYVDAISKKDLRPKAADPICSSSPYANNEAKKTHTRRLTDRPDSSFPKYASERQIPDDVLKY
jgi:hypothetical protein